MLYVNVPQDFNECNIEPANAQPENPVTTTTQPPPGKHSDLKL